MFQVNLETNECMEFVSPRKVRRRTLDFGGGGDDVTSTSESDGALMKPGARNVAILDLDNPPQENRNGGRALKKTKGKKGKEKVKVLEGVCMMQNAKVVWGREGWSTTANKRLR